MLRFALAVSRPSFPLWLLALLAASWTGPSLAAVTGDPCTVFAPAAAPPTPDGVLGAGNQLHVCAGDNQSVPVNADFPEPLRVRLLDPDGQPLAGNWLLVTVIPAANGASAQLFLPDDPFGTGHAETDANGFVEISARANGVAGTYQVQLCLTGKGGCGDPPLTWARFTLTNTAAAVLPPAQPVPGPGVPGLVLLAGLLLLLALRRLPGALRRH